MKSQFRHCAIRSLIENWELKIENSRKGFYRFVRRSHRKPAFFARHRHLAVIHKGNHAFFHRETIGNRLLRRGHGFECALYWDSGPAEACFPKSNEVGEPNPNTVSCNGQSNQVSFWVEPTILAATTTFLLTFVPTGCANVIVGKTAAGSTVIESRGQNECGAGVNPGRVERALRVRY